LSKDAADRRTVGCGMAYESKPVWSTVSLGTPTMPGPRVSDAIDEFLQAVDAGTARDRHGRPFGRESERELHRSLESYIGSELGDRRLNYVRREHLEALLDGLESAGVPPLRLAALVTSLRALYDYAAEQDLVRHNPAEGVGIRYKQEEAETKPAIVDRAIALTLRLLTLAFLLLAVVLLAI
jgi:site-specific recombinase XerC